MNYSYLTHPIVQDKLKYVCLHTGPQGCQWFHIFGKAPWQSTKSGRLFPPVTSCYPESLPAFRRSMLLSIEKLIHGLGNITGPVYSRVSGVMQSGLRSTISTTLSTISSRTHIRQDLRYATLTPSSTFVRRRWIVARLRGLLEMSNSFRKALQVPTNRFDRNLRCVTIKQFFDYLKTRWTLLFKTTLISAQVTRKLY